jgi:hypothetical protein
VCRVELRMFLNEREFNRHVRMCERIDEGLKQERSESIQTTEKAGE